jgi:hypothetical protein
MKHVSEIVKEQQPGEQWNSLPLAPQRTVERVTLDQLDAGYHPMVARAINSARAWASRKIAGVENASLVLVASPIYRPDGKPHPERTGYGVGKTHIARAIQWASYVQLEDGPPVAPAGRFFTASDLMELLGSGNIMSELVPAGTETTNGRIDGTPVLVIDDVGTEGILPYISSKSQDYEKQARYFEIINYCYTRKTSVVITANMTLEDLAQHVGGRSWSRLQEMAPSGFMIDLTGVPDYRKKKGGR